jgi:hypothetical protein
MKGLVIHMEQRPAFDSTRDSIKGNLLAKVEVTIVVG